MASAVQPVFGMPMGDCLIASPRDGVAQIMPQSWQVSYYNDGYAQVDISGILLESDWQNINKTALASVPMTELLAEVNRRIKAGENVTKK